MGHERLTAVTDAGPLIHLTEIGCLSILSIFDTLHVPEAVWAETVGCDRISGEDLLKSSTIERHNNPRNDVTRFIEKNDLKDLHSGERECLYLARQINISILLTDDLAVREAAKLLRLVPVGSLGIVARAYRQGMISMADARGSAMEALVYGVLLGNRPRKETLDFLCSLLEGPDLKGYDHFWNAAASCIRDLYPEESMDIIRSAYEKGLIWPGYIRIESFRGALSKDKAEFLKQQREYIESKIQEDFHDYMSWWACFNEGKSHFRNKIDNLLSIESPLKKKDRRKRKSKRKLAKASKRNR